MTNDIAVPSALAVPDRIGQATAVEQSRAVAEVQGAILVAQRCPRDVTAALGQMKDSCRQKHLAERAFFKFSRGGSSVSGATVYLARELARTWGNVQYGVTELSRDDVRGQSEMMAFAWDVQTNTRVESKFIVPHKRDTQKGPKDLTDMRDIYENNANSGARRVREAIFSILPPWFVEQAKELCYQTLEDGGGEPMPKRIAHVITVFGELGVTQDQLESKLDRPSSKWTPVDLAGLQVTYGALKRGEVKREDEFPPERVTAAEVTGQKPATPRPKARSNEELVHRTDHNEIVPGCSFCDADLLTAEAGAK